MGGQGSGWFVRTETYEREIHDPDSVVLGEEGKPKLVDGEPVYERKGTVTLRPLNTGDRTELEDNIRMEVGNEEATPEMLLGTMRRLTVTRALVGWSLDEELNELTIKRLHPAVFEQIFAHITFGNVPAAEALAGPPTEPPREAEQEPATPGNPPPLEAAAEEPS